MRKLGAFVFIFWLVALNGLNGQVLNPTYQIRWPSLVGNGTPTSLSLACTSANYGQPYQNNGVTPHTNYTCGQDGWVQLGTGGGGGGSCGANNIPCTNTANQYTTGSKQSVTSNGAFAGFQDTGTGTDPNTLSTGDEWFNSTDKRLHYYDGAANRSLFTLNEYAFISPKALGAKGDALKVNDCTVTASSTTLTCASSHFVSTDVGKSVGIPFAGSNNGTNTYTQTFTTTIAAYVSATQVTLAAAPITSIQGPRTVSDFACTANSLTPSSATANFTQGDVGKVFNLPNGGLLQSQNPPINPQEEMITAVNSTTGISVSAICLNSFASNLAITSWAVTGTNTATITTSNQNGAFAGQSITIAGLTTGSFLNGTWTIGSVPTGTTFTFTVSHANATGTEAGTASITSPSQATTIPGATVTFGSDDTTALNTAITTAVAQRRMILLDYGANYLTTASLVPASNMVIWGHGAGNSIISPIGSGFAAFQNITGNTFANGLYDVRYYNFEIDCTGVVPNTYSTANKAIYTTFNVRAVVDHMYIHNSYATAIGMDYNPNSSFTNNVLDYPGYGPTITGSGGGAAGIGIGTGKLIQEPQIITGNIVSHFGVRGIFVEGQSANILSTGIVIANNTVRWQGLSGAGAACIADHGTQGTIISNNTVEFCTLGIETNLAFAGSLYSYDWQIIGNHIGNSGTAIFINNKTGGGVIKNNLAVGGVNKSATTGTFVDLNQITGGTPTLITIQGNTYHEMNNHGIFIDTGNFGQIDIIGNDCLNVGISAGTNRACISIEGTATATALNVDGNIGNDTRSPQGTSGGLLVGSGTTVSRLYYGTANDFGRLPVDATFTGTVTSLVGPMASYSSLTPVTLATGAATVSTGLRYISSSTYNCTGRNITTPANAVTITNVSGTSFTIAGTGTDQVMWGCVGR